jgi:outer membrane protein TolC
VQTHLAATAGLSQTTALLGGLDLSLMHSQTRDTSTGQTSRRSGQELELPLPLFDWGHTSNARLAALGRASEARLRAVAVLARSEAREAWLAYRTAWDLARHHQQHLLPLRRLIQEETQLRYNGMLSSVFDLLAETRNHTAAINASLEAQRDAWLADVDLHTALHVTSPGALTTLTSDTPATGSSQGH